MILKTLGEQISLCWNGYSQCSWRIENDLKNSRGTDKSLLKWIHLSIFLEVKEQNHLEDITEPKDHCMYLNLVPESRSV